MSATRHSRPIATTTLSLVSYGLPDSAPDDAPRSIAPRRQEVLPMRRRAHTTSPRGRRGGAPPFKRALRELRHSHFDGAIDYPTFVRRLLELHFQHGRRGYTVDDLERDLADHEVRLAQRTRRDVAESAEPSPRQPLPEPPRRVA